LLVVSWVRVVVVLSVECCAVSWSMEVKTKKLTATTYCAMTVVPSD
jgi:hypothetical protein